MDAQAEQLLHRLEQAVNGRPEKWTTAILEKFLGEVRDLLWVGSRPRNKAIYIKKLCRHIIVIEENHQYLKQKLGFRDLAADAEQVDANLAAGAEQVDANLAADAEQVDANLAAGAEQVGANHAADVSDDVTFLPLPVHSDGESWPWLPDSFWAP